MLSYKDRGPKYSFKFVFDLMARTPLPFSAKFTSQQSEDQSDSHCKKIYFCMSPKKFTYITSLSVLGRKLIFFQSSIVLTCSHLLSNLITVEILTLQVF